MQPSNPSIRSNSGMAEISLHWSSTAVWASTRRLAWSLAPTLVVGAAHALAVDGHDLTLGPRKGRLHPVPKALLEPGSIQPSKDSSQSVVRGDPVRQCRKVCSHSSLC